MRDSEFWMRVEDVFGEDHGRLLVTTQHMSVLGARTAAEALEAGIPQTEVWAALCDHQDVAEEQRLGRDRPLRRTSDE